MHKVNWDNIRYVLTVADHGSVNAASRVLGVNHATVLRRIAAFEADHGGPVFERTATGYHVLPERARVIEAAREVENAVGSVERLMHGARAPLKGLVRVSSTDSICQAILPPLIAELQAKSSELQVELMSNNSPLDFSRMQADISVRPAMMLPEDMTGETNVDLVFGAFAAPGSPDTWLGLSGALARSAPATWMSGNIAPEDLSGCADSFLVLRELALLGLGIAVLPVFLGNQTPGLEPRRGVMPDMSVPIWVATHAELHDVPRIRVVRQHILRFLASRREILAGNSGQDVNVVGCV